MVVILEGNGLITRGEEGRKEGPRSVHAMPCHAVVSSRISPLPLHPSLFNVVVVVEWECSEGKLERTAAAAAAAASMQKGEEPISEPNWAAKRPFVRSVARPSVRVRSTWKCGSSCFQTRMGIGEGRATERGRKEGRNTDFTARWNMKVTTTTNLIAAMSLKSETRIRHRDRLTERRPLEPQAGEQHQNGI